MKRYFASIGLIAASVIYMIAQQVQGDNNQVVTGSDAATTTDTTSVTQPTYSTANTGTTNTTTSNTSSNSSSGSSGSTSTKKTGKYTDGTYTGSSSDAFYGYVQVQAVVSGGKLTAVNILQYPNDRSTSRYINSQALPYLEQEAISVQSANVNTISGASDTSAAFRESLSSALSQASA